MHQSLKMKSTVRETVPLSHRHCYWFCFVDEAELGSVMHHGKKMEVHMLLFCPACNDV
jgi:hypothetical protein